MNRAFSILSLARVAGLAGGLAAAPCAIAAEPPAASRVLTLEECVHRALAKNFDVQIERFNTANARETLVISQATYDPTLTASATRTGSRDSSSTLPGTITDSFTEVRLGASQRIITGGTINLSSVVDRSKGSPAVSPLVNPVYNSDLLFTVTQPLLKGGGVAANRAVIQQARSGVNQADFNFRSAVMTVVLNTEFAFYNLYFARQQLRVVQLSLEAAQKLYDENKAKREAGVLTDVDVLTAEVGVATQQRAVLLAQQTVHNNEDALRALIGQFELDADVTTGDLVEPTNEPLDVTATFERAKTAQPEYQAAKTVIEQLRLAALTAKNARLPQLDFNGAVGYNNSGGRLDRTIGDLIGNDGYNWQVGLALTYPWGTHADSARYRQAQNNLQRETLRLLQSEQTLLVQARSSVRAVETDREAMVVAALASRLSEKQYELEKARFDAGLSTARLVLDAQRDLDNSRVNEVSSKVSLLQSLANLRRLEGRTFDAYNIQLQP